MSDVLFFILRAIKGSCVTWIKLVNDGVFSRITRKCYKLLPFESCPRVVILCIILLILKNFMVHKNNTLS